jgi:hypothetical protein
MSKLFNKFGINKYFFKTTALKMGLNLRTPIYNVTNAHHLKAQKLLKNKMFDLDLKEQQKRFKAFKKSINLYKKR